MIEAPHNVVKLHEGLSRDVVSAFGRSVHRCAMDAAAIGHTFELTLNVPGPGGDDGDKQAADSSEGLDAEAERLVDLLDGTAAEGEATGKSPPD